MQMLQGNPLLLPHSLQELLAKDTVQVALVPERKGLFLKHVEYEVSSQVPTDHVRGGRVWAGMCAEEGQGAAGRRAEAQDRCQSRAAQQACPCASWLSLASPSLRSRTQRLRTPVPVGGLLGQTLAGQPGRGLRCWMTEA